MVMWRHCVRLLNAQEAQLEVIAGEPIWDIWSAKRLNDIKLAAYYLRYSEKIPQVHHPTDLTVQAIRTIRELDDSDGNWDRRLPVDLFTDTREAGIVSLKGNRYAQVYAHMNTWCKAYPMAKKSDAHETLSLLFAQERVPSTQVMDGAREQVMGEFRHKARQADCHVKQTEPYFPWQNAAEGTIREPKKGAGRKMVKSNSPRSYGMIV